MNKCSCVGDDHVLWISLRIGKVGGKWEYYMLELKLLSEQERRLTTSESRFIFFEKLKNLVRERKADFSDKDVEFSVSHCSLCKTLQDDHEGIQEDRLLRLSIREDESFCCI